MIRWSVKEPAKSEKMPFLRVRTEQSKKQKKKQREECKMIWICDCYCSRDLRQIKSIIRLKEKYAKIAREMKLQSILNFLLRGEIWNQIMKSQYVADLHV